jgi:hypothetical protein
VEALQLHSNTQSHWSSGSTICSPLRGAAHRVSDAPTLTIERGSSVSNVSLQYHSIIVNPIFLQVKKTTS